MEVTTRTPAEDMEEFERMQDDYACHRNMCQHCGDDIAQDDLGEWVDTEDDRTCPAADVAGAGVEHVPAEKRHA